MQPQVGQHIQFCENDKDGNALAPKAGQVTAVNSATNVNCSRLNPSGQVAVAFETSVSYIEVGGSAPTGANAKWAQEIAVA
jgi:hypothetical protein